MSDATLTTQGDSYETAASTGTERFLIFTLGGETYALDIRQVREIIELRPLTAVPMMPPFVRGVLNLRGRVLPVVDLLARFEKGVTEEARRTGVIVVECTETVGDEAQIPPAGSAGFGIMVDTVNKVVHLSQEDIEPPPDFGAGIRAEFISGMARYDDDFVVVLDMAQVLHATDMALAVAGATGSGPIAPACE